MRTAAEYLRKYPNARVSTIVAREIKARKIADLEAQIAADKRVNEFRQSIGYVSWFRRGFRALTGRV